MKKTFLLGFGLFLGACSPFLSEPPPSDLNMPLRIAESDSEKILIDLAEAGRFETLTAAVQEGIDLQFCSPYYHQTPLHFAALHHAIPFAQTLLKSESGRAQRDLRDRFGMTALHYAARQTDTAFLSLLLDAGAASDLPDSRDGFTPIFEAVARDNADGTRLLCHPPFTADRFGRSPFSFAADFNKMAVFPILLTASPAPDELRHALLTACKKNYPEIVFALFPHPGAPLLSLEQSDSERRTPLMFASSQPDTRILERLLLFHPSLDALDSEGNTALHWGARNNAFLSVKLLLEISRKNDAWLNHRNSRGETALFVASAQGFDRALTPLFEFGAQINIPDLSQRTPLIAAAEHRFMDIVQILVEKGADINAADSRGMNAAMVAAQNIAPNIVRFLLREGININQKDNQGRYLQDVAREAGCDEVIRMIETHDY